MARLLGLLVGVPRFIMMPRKLPPIFMEVVQAYRIIGLMLFLCLRHLV